MNDEFYFIFFIGNFYFAHLKSHECIELPTEWQNRASSLLLKKCIVVYTASNCKSVEQLQVFANLNEKYFDVSFSKPNQIASYNFHGSL